MVPPPRRSAPCTPSLSPPLPKGFNFDAVFFEEDLDCVDKAQDIIDRFNAAAVIPSFVYLNHPEVWTPFTRGRLAGVKFLVEPYIHDFTKYI